LRYRPLGQSGIQASVVAFGAWAIGGWPWGGTDEANAVDAIHRALDLGINLIDTAPAYGLGLSEEIIGRALAGRRDKAVIATKCGLTWHTDKGAYFFSQNDRPVHRYLGPESIRQEVELSLKRLATDYIDLYQTHWQDDTTPIADTMGELMKLKAEGKIRAIGVSNVKLHHLEQYRKIGPVDSAQELYNMLDRGIEAELLPYCLRNNIAVLAYSPLSQGLLTGKVGPEREFPEGDMRRRNPRFSVEGRQRIASMLDEFAPIAKARGITLGQLAIAWTVAQPGLTHALVGARNADQVDENAGAGDVELTPDEHSVINGAIARHN